jgi:hypothetical protein
MLTALQVPHRCRGLLLKVQTAAHAIIALRTHGKMNLLNFVAIETTTLLATGVFIFVR